VAVARVVEEVAVDVNPMKTQNTALQLPALVLAICSWVLPNVASTAAAAASPQEFPAPEAAVAALQQAVATTNRSALTTLFGEVSRQLVNPDEVQGAIELACFTAAFQEQHRLVRNSDSRMTLEVGSGGWPFPIPLVQAAGGWHFDTLAGLEELLNRRIGRNELDVLRVLRAFPQAQREYASRDRDGDQVLEFAQKITSSSGQADGLFWPPTLNGEISPLGPFMAFAQTEGYAFDPVFTDAGPQPFHGYLYKLLARQGRHAPGGKYDYIINGNMIGGFALVAWPAEYGESGIMTFLVNQQGRIYQRDLGPQTAKRANAIKAYDPDENWMPSPD
jgi:hypothetical protein